jgi:hypothetical protein
VTRSGSINYVEFLDGFRIADVGGAFGLRRNMSSLDAVPSEVTADSTVTPATNWQQAIIQKVIHTLFQYRIELSQWLFLDWGVGVSVPRLFDVW